MSQLDHDEPTTGVDPVRELGKQLPWDRPDAARREGVRSSLLVAAADTPPVRPRRGLLVGAGFVAGALAAAAVALVIVRPAAVPATPATGNQRVEHVQHAQIESSSLAELEHVSTPTATGTDEIVRVRTGSVRLAVPTVRAGDRVRTRTGDAEVEGTGAYEVVVAHDKLTSVRVASGTAKVIVDGQTIVLAAGQTWTAPIVTADLTPAPSRPVEPPPPTTTLPPPPPTPTVRTRVAPPAKVPAIEPAPAPAPAPAPVAPPAPAISTGAPPAPAVATSTEQHFRTGWALLRDNQYGAAADELALAAAGSEPLAADARYFQAVALTKAGRAREAEAALVAFLDAAPGSTRRGRAAVMLGRLIAARGDARSARSWFVTASTDADASVAGAAKAELAKLDR